MLWAGWALGSATAAVVGAGTGSGNGPPGSGRSGAAWSNHTRAVVAERGSRNCWPFLMTGRPGHNLYVLIESIDLLYPLIPTVNAAVYPFVVSPPVIVASSDERLSANTMSLAFDVGFRPLLA